MAHLATICGDCSHVSLVAFNRVVAEAPTCRRCGGRLQVVPSCSYGAADVALFEELGAAIGNISSLDAQRLASAVGHALWSGAFSEVFLALADRWASLVPLVLVTGRNQDQQRRVLSMLKTILDAMTPARRSGLRVAVRSTVAEGQPPSKRSGRG